MRPAFLPPTLPYAFVQQARYLSQRVAALPGGYLLRDGFRAAQTLLNRQRFLELKRLLALPALRPLAVRHPRLAYKYLVPCLAAGFSRAAQLAIMRHHYGFWVAQARLDFFALVVQEQEIWHTQDETHRFSIALAYPFESDFEGELSLIFRVDATAVYTVSFTCAPAHITPGAATATLLVSRVQGTKNFALIKQATKRLHEITPAVLLLHAICGLAQACGITELIGVGTRAQPSHLKAANQFNYDGFWQQLGARPAVGGLFLLSLPPPDKPLESIRAHHRARTLRKRQYKQRLRADVQSYVAQYLLLT